LFVNTSDKRALLTEVLKNPKITRVLVFTRTKHGANRVAEQLERAQIKADAIHGNKSQSARQRALESFRAGQVRVLVATDIAARGIDIDGISHVINYDLPDVPESYVHRIGRNRAGRRRRHRPLVLRRLGARHAARHREADAADARRHRRSPLRQPAEHRSGRRDAANAAVSNGTAAGNAAARVSAAAAPAAIARVSTAPTFGVIQLAGSVPDATSGLSDWHRASRNGYKEPY